MQIDVIRDAERLDDLRLVWRYLWNETREASVFQSFEWVTRYARLHGGCHVLVVRDRPRPLGILPLFIERRPTAMGPARVLGYPLPAWGWFCGPLGPNPTATLWAAGRYLRHHAAQWEAFELNGIDRDHVDFRRTPLSLDRHGLRSRETACGLWHILDPVLRPAAPTPARMVAIEHASEQLGDTDSATQHHQDPISLLHLAGRMPVHAGRRVCPLQSEPDGVKALLEAASDLGCAWSVMVRRDDHPVALLMGVRERQRCWELIARHADVPGAANQLTHLRHQVAGEMTAQGAAYHICREDRPPVRRQLAAYRYTHIRWNSPLGQAWRLHRWWDQYRSAGKTAGWLTRSARSTSQ